MEINFTSSRKRKRREGKVSLFDKTNNVVFKPCLLDFDQAKPAIKVLKVVNVSHENCLLNQNQDQIQDQVQNHYHNWEQIELDTHESELLALFRGHRANN